MFLTAQKANMNGKIRGQHVVNYGGRDDVKETFWSTETTGLTNVGIFLCNFRCRWGHHKSKLRGVIMMAVNIGTAEQVELGEKMYSS